MPFFNLLLISVLSVTFLDGDRPSEMPNDRCESLMLEFTTRTEAQRQILTLKPAGGKAPYKLILSVVQTGEIQSEDFTKTEFVGIQAGKYVAVVIDNARCMKKTEIQIP